MASRPIVYWPDPVLDSPTRQVSDFSSLVPLLDDMMDSMRAAKGVGIAANQIGEGTAIAWVSPEEMAPFEIINPVVLEKSEPVELEEGCLSVPGMFEKVKRFHKVKVRYQDRAGVTHELSAEGRLAHVLQHEIDHTNGVLFIDYISKLKRDMVMKRFKKAAKKGEPVKPLSEDKEPSHHIG